MKKNKNKKSGAAAVEAVLALSIILPILFSFIFGGYNYYLKQADNINLNFEVGRMLATSESCTEAGLKRISDSDKFSQYNLITVIDAVQKQTYTSAEAEGTIVVYCESSS